MKLSDPVRSFLEQPLIARLSVIDDAGYPHTVPIWFARDGDDLMFFSSRTARKIGHAQANPRGAVTVGGDPYGAEGYLLKGELSIEEDPENRWLSLITHRYEPNDLAEQHVAEWSKEDLVLMRFRPRKVIRV